MTLIVGAGALLFLHQLPVSVVVARAAQLQILLLHWVGRYLLDGQPVQGLLSGQVRGHAIIHLAKRTQWQFCVSSKSKAFSLSKISGYGEGK